MLRQIMNTGITRNILLGPAHFVIAVVIIMVTLSMRNASFRLLPGKNNNYPVTSFSGKTDSLPNGKGISIKNVKTIVVDENNIKWFCTDAGIISFNGENWKLHNVNGDLPIRDLRDIAYAVNPEGSEFWIASPAGATFVRHPLDDQKEVIIFNKDNSDILSEEVIRIVAGKNSLRWIGTDKGISALLRLDHWLTPSYDIHYPEDMFQDWPITSMATSIGGDSLYAGTAGAGIVRVYRDEVDAISGASVYAQWGPIILPSDNILSVFIAPDGTQWFGTEAGIAKHTGNDTLDNWTVYTTEDGLVDNFVQAIIGDQEGKLWFGTRGGVSIFNGSSWISYTTGDGLASNHILSIAIDHNGVVWMGTDVGITAFENGEFINY